MEENNAFETEEVNESLQAVKKKSRNWNTVIGGATAACVFLFGALGALVVLLGGVITKFLWMKTSINKVVKVIIIAIVWIVLILLYVSVIGALSTLK